MEHCEQHAGRPMRTSSASVEATARCCTRAALALRRTAARRAARRMETCWGRPTGRSPRPKAGCCSAAAACILAGRGDQEDGRCVYQRPLHIALLHVILPSARAWGADPSCGSSGGRPGGPERLGELHALGDARSRQGYTLPPPTRYPPAAPAGDVHYCWHCPSPTARVSPCLKNLTSQWKRSICCTV